MSSRPKKVVAAGTTDEPQPELRLCWTHRAEADLASIYNYIADDDPLAAEQWVEKLMERATLAAHAPHAGRIVPEFGVSELREVLVQSYRIVYRIRSAEVHVVTVFEGHRRFPADVDLDSV